MSATSTDTPAPVVPKLTSGLGNRLFQLYAAAGVADAWGRPLAIWTGALKECPHGSVAGLTQLFPEIPILENLPTATPPLELRESPTHLFTYTPFGDPPSQETAVILTGFRQTPRYFPPPRPGGLTPNWDNALGGPELRRWLERDAGLCEPAEQRRTVALHVRLGDYMKLPHHQVDLDRYYRAAVSRVPVGGRVHLFSDEPERAVAFAGSLCASAGRSIHFTVARRRTDLESLYEMSLCLGGTITGNSTFSWWGAWFAHERGAEWATYPDRMGAGLPLPTELAPAWGTVLPTAD